MPLHRLLYILTIILLPSQLGLHLWPDWAFVLGRRIDYLSPTLFVTDICMCATVCSWMLYQRTNIWQLITKSVRSNWKWYGTIGACIIINILISRSPFVAVYRWGKIAEFAIFGLYIYRTKISLRFTAACLIIPMLYSSILAIVQFALQHSVGSIFWFVGERTFQSTTPGIAKVDWCWLTSSACTELLRPYATFPHPNVLAGFLAITIPLLMYSATNERNRYFKMFSAITIGIASCALACTFSRSSWIVALVGISLMLRKQYKIPPIWKALIGVLLIGVTLISLRYFSLLLAANESVIERIELLRITGKLWKTYPLFGTGLGQFIVLLPSVLDAKHLYFIQPVHSVPALIIVETGLVGFTLLLILGKFYVSRIKKKHIPLIHTLPLISFLILGLVDHYSWTLQQGQLFLTVLLATTLAPSSKKLIQ